MEDLAFNPWTIHVVPVEERDLEANWSKPSCWPILFVCPLLDSYMRLPRVTEIVQRTPGHCDAESTPR